MIDTDQLEPLTDEEIESLMEQELGCTGRGYADELTEEEEETNQNTNQHNLNYINT